MSKNNLEFGRTLRASTVGFAVGCRVGELQKPAFGSLVKAQPVDEREAIYGLIYDMHIDDDPLVRRLVLAENPPEAIINDQRDNRLLPIEMSVLAIGYAQNNTIRHSLPPRPPLNLDPVELCQEQDEIIRFTNNLGYLRLILRAQGGNVPVDQLLVAHITQIHYLRGSDNDWAMRVIAELVELLRSNYDVLIPTLEAVSEALPELRLTTAD